MVLSSTWAEAHFGKAFALLKLGEVSEARSSLERAVALSPNNSQYLSELAYIYLLKKDWPTALKYYQQAEEFAYLGASPEDKAYTLAVARRGSGYVFVELDRLDEAEEKYLQCLATDPNDVKARGELEYVRNLKREQ